MCSNPSCLYIDQNGSTALVSAAETGHHECLSILLSHGAKVDQCRTVSILIGQYGVGSVIIAMPVGWIA